MLSIKRAIKTVDEVIELVDDDKTKERLQQLLADYTTLYERRENTLKRQTINRIKVNSDEEKRKEKNEYANNYYHTITKPKKLAKKKDLNK
jgi:hypothetical protein